MKQIPTIRVIWWTKENHSDQSGLLIEQLRYMGLVRVLRDWTPSSSGELRGNNLSGLSDTEGSGYYTLEFQAPRGLIGHDKNMWCEQNAKRMQSFGINAVVAPQWNGVWADK